MNLLNLGADMSTEAREELEQEEAELASEWTHPYWKAV